MLKQKTLRTIVLSLHLSLIAITCVAQKFTLEQVMSSPFPSELVAAKQGARIAWVFDAKGVRNIWVADGPNFSARQLTNYTEDDGQSISGVVFTPDGKTLLFARGSETNREGEVANPVSEIQPRKQQVWAMAVSGGQPRLLGEMNCRGEGCEDIQVSPDGQQAVWTANKQIWIAPISGTQPARELFWARGSSSQPRWSPDGKHIAFVSDREDHRWIGIYTVGENRLRWIAPTVDRDTAPRWSPDGRQLVFIRSPGEQHKQPLIPVRSVPWSIWLADVATGNARELWRSGVAENDSLPPQAGSHLYFTTANRIVFPSEQDGRYHLYSTATSAGTPALLTPGNFDVEQTTLSADGRTVIYSSNQNDVDRRHLWRVSVEGGTPQQLTRGEGIEWEPVQTGDGRHIVCFHSSATVPAMPCRVAADGRVETIARDAMPDDFPSQQLVTPRQVTFKSDDGLTIHAQLFVPAGNPQKAPALIFLHGGPPRQMMLGFHNRKYYHNAYAANQYLASRGYVVLALNFRLGIMYGRGFRQPPNAGWRGASEYKDVLAAARYLQSLPNVDAKKIGLWGGSYGGYLTALGLARNSDLFAAGVDIHGVHDWSVFLRSRVASARFFAPDPDGDAPDFRQAMDLAFRSSPISAMSTWRSPVLLIHGDDDRNVPFDQTTDLAQRLKEQKVPFEQLIFPDELHSFLLWRNWITAYGAMAEFLDRVLKTAAR